MTGMPAQNQVHSGGRREAHSFPRVDDKRGESGNWMLLRLLIRCGADRGAEQALVHHSEADRVPGQLDGERLHQEEEQVVRTAESYGEKAISWGKKLCGKEVVAAANQRIRVVVNVMNFDVRC